ncbi:hypothetical protein CVS48_10270 [Achromobacter spanius]|nr:hypothetical protein CVS48_10270 [Achromobacter spanius]
MEKVFIIPLHVTRMEDSVMPVNFSGAYVSCYASGVDYVEATKRVLARLLEDGLHPEEILQPIQQMDVNGWSQHVLEQWPHQAKSLPNQNEFNGLIEQGGVVYGPFGSYI